MLKSEPKISSVDILSPHACMISSERLELRKSKHFIHNSATKFHIIRLLVVIYRVPTGITVISLDRIRLLLNLKYLLEDGSIKVIHI